MSTLSDQFASARHDALALLQERWGLERKGAEKKGRALEELIAMPFLELSDQELDLALRVPTPTHLGHLKDALRALRSERFQELEHPPEPDSGAKPASARRALLAEIASEHFRGGMGSWLTSITPDHGLSSSSAEDLEKIQNELRYRLNLLNNMTILMQREIDSLETQIKTRRMIDADELPL